MLPGSICKANNPGYSIPLIVTASTVGRGRVTSNYKFPGIPTIAARQIFVSQRLTGNRLGSVTYNHAWRHASEGLEKPVKARRLLGFVRVWWDFAGMYLFNLASFCSKRGGTGSATSMRSSLVLNRSGR